ncbi:MAG: type II toxin-antitoxin system VapC family toxin [Prochlorotrichaceae cyanobacterium]|jgi:ribonuclease VapC
MIIDPSAIVAIIYGEPEDKAFLNLISNSQTCLISSPGYLELAIVLSTAYGSKGIEKLDLFLQELSISIVSFTSEHAKLATEAFLTFGKGRHPAKLNMGDCFSYALAKATGQPLLFKGNDFSQTDINVAYNDRSI